jgi:hypothetical protein
MKHLAINWKKDSTSLLSLPSAEVFVCSKEGYEVVGEDDEVNKIHEFALSRPDQIKVVVCEELDNEELQAYFPALRHFEPCCSELSDEDIFARLNAATWDWRLVFYIDNHENRRWSLDSQYTPSGNDKVVAQCDFEAFTVEFAENYCMEVLNAGEWEREGYIDEDLMKILDEDY